MLDFTHPDQSGPLMFRLFIVSLVAVSLAAQQPGLPVIGAIEVFGNHKVSAEKIRKAMGVTAGDPLPPSKGDVEEKLEALPDVLSARLQAVCCEAGRAVLFAGILERGASPPAFHDWPAKEVALPEEIAAVYGRFTAALDRAVRDGDTAEDLTSGHSVMANSACRVQQERMSGLAEMHSAVLRDVLRNAADPEQRAIAAYVTGYLPGSQEVADDLLYALQDPDDAVRANATRALKALAVLGRADPELGLKVRSTWFVEMLNSIVLSDRIEAAKALLVLTDRPDENTAANIRERAKDSLFEMARWQYLPHALPAYLLLGRVAGWSDKQLEASWAGGDRDKVIEEIRKAGRKK